MLICKAVLTYCCRHFFPKFLPLIYKMKDAQYQPSLVSHSSSTMSTQPDNSSGEMILIKEITNPCWTPPSRTCSKSWNWPFTFSLRRHTLWRPSTKGSCTLTSQWTWDLGWPLRTPNVLCSMCWWQEVRGSMQQDHGHPYGDKERYGAVDLDQTEQFCLSLWYWIWHMIGLTKRLIWDKETLQGLIKALMWPRVRCRPITEASCGLFAK